VFAGNTHDSRTLQDDRGNMEARHGMLGRVMITPDTRDGQRR